MRIEIRTGSDSDLPKIEPVFRLLDRLGIEYQTRVLSAHRTPQTMTEEARKLLERGFKASIGAAGGSAHLPGMTASETPVPVIALPVKTSHFDGVDSLYSMIQMPPGIPVGCVGIGDAEGAAIVAAQIAYLDNDEIRRKICEYRGIQFRSRQFRKRTAIVFGQKQGLEKELSQAASFLGQVGIDHQEYVWREGLVDEILNGEFSTIIAVQDISQNTLKIIREISSKTDIPVIGVPWAREDFSQELFRKILTEPVANMGLNRLLNGAIYAAKIIGMYDKRVLEAVVQYSKRLEREVREKDNRLTDIGIAAYLEEMRK